MRKLQAGKDESAIARGDMEKQVVLYIDRIPIMRPLCVALTTRV